MYSQHFCRQNAEAPKMDPGMLYFSESMRRADQLAIAGKKLRHTPQLQVGYKNC